MDTVVQNRGEKRSFLFRIKTTNYVNYCSKLSHKKVAIFLSELNSLVM